MDLCSTKNVPYNVEDPNHERPKAENAIYDSPHVATKLGMVMIVSENILLCICA